MHQSNHHFSLSVQINSPREKVWQTLIDVPTWHEWDTELKQARLLDEFALGAKGVLTPLTGPTLNFVISELVPYQSYTFKTKMPLGWLVINRTLTVKNETTEFTDEIAFTGFLKRIFGAMLGGRFRAVLPEVMNNFKTIVEGR
ncbi:MAG: polyketide cyclase [Candidatus Kapaibacterium sp.]|nr:MAG: polyketide cyclase [Candidatus Kapabacteria bacterium]